MKMIRKLELVSDSKFEKPSYINDMGGFNSLPTPFEKTTIDEYYDHLFTWGIQYVEFRQIILKERSQLFNTEIFYFYDIAFALVNNYNTKEVDVYRVGCNHEYLEDSVGFDHTYTCKKCNTKFTVNSSD
jgi:hypothetical protein